MNARALNDPFVVGVDDRGEVFVCDYSFRNMMAKAHYLRIAHLCKYVKGIAKIMKMS
jgi:hypothetical protein